ncbi:MAG: GxxExxY protein [Gemmatimonadota bacterium]
MNARDRVFEPERKENIACALKVHRELGPGFLETVYHQAIAVNLSTRKIPFERERGVQDLFRGVEVGFHRLDLVVRNMIVVEIESVVDLAPIHFAQLRCLSPCDRPGNGPSSKLQQPDPPGKTRR